MKLIDYRVVKLYNRGILIVQVVIGICSRRSPVLSTDEFLVQNVVQKFVNVIELLICKETFSTSFLRCEEDH